MKTVSNISEGATFVPPSTVCPYMEKYMKNVPNWSCANNSYFGTEGKTLRMCETNDDYIEIVTEASEYIVLFTHKSNLSRLIREKPKENEENICDPSRPLPDAYLLDAILLSPPLEIRSNSTEMIHLVITYNSLKHKIDNTNACVAAIVVYENNTDPLVKCINTNIYENYVASYIDYPTKHRNDINCTLYHDNEGNKETHCTDKTHHDITVYYALILTNGETKDYKEINEVLKTAGFSGLYISIVLIAILFCISTFV